VDKNEPKQLKKGTYSTFHLRTDPTSTASPTYDFVVPYLYADSTVRQAVQFKKKISRVLSGLNVTTAHGKKNVIEQMLKDSLQAIYNGAVRRESDRQYDERLAAAADDAACALVLRPAINLATLNAGWHAVMNYLAPPKALSRVKRYFATSLS
jgi:hypothetical protein